MLLKIASKLLLVTGILLLLGFAFRIPMLWQALVHEPYLFSHKPINYIGYPVLLIIAGWFFIYISRKVR